MITSHLLLHFYFNQDWIGMSGSSSSVKGQIWPFKRHSLFKNFSWISFFSLKKIFYPKLGYSVLLNGFKSTLNWKKVFKTLSLWRIVPKNRTSVKYFFEWENFLIFQNMRTSIRPCEKVRDFWWDLLFDFMLNGTTDF